MLLERFEQAKIYLNQMVIGQQELVNGLLTALIADGHLLVEGPPGLAKTRAVKALADSIEGDFHRVQFTPDLLPADLTGTDIFRQETGQFEFQAGPLFHNLLLADEINRAPAKVQSALLEAMAENQITVGKTSYPLPSLFLVLATQNPIENEGTYPLPEAQLDRFLLHLSLDYPGPEVERQILALSRQEALAAPLKPPQPLTQKEIFSARKQALELYLAPQLEEYMVQLIDATRSPQQYDDELARYLEWGVSPRATISLERCARARAWLSGRDYVSPEDVQAVLPNVLRHRLLLSYQAEAEGISADTITARIIKRVALA
ncbi:MoxR family ATPase [Ferrimonas sediminicola]|uniref:MoxR family ATPase n=1 Tax=Ferrimonas sediminicola TaxID=2569538 RepID=A0A4V5NX73_9GAMM|nr:MoxR family ATPase [Ferrimonas sediminicola]TKB49829.1 MoxR family ATPase [Ferrimonas sediminicola]